MYAWEGLNLCDAGRRAAGGKWSHECGHACMACMSSQKSSSRLICEASVMLAWISIPPVYLQAAAARIRGQEIIFCCASQPRFTYLLRLLVHL